MANTINKNGELSININKIVQGGGEGKGTTEQKCCEGRTFVKILEEAAAKDQGAK